MLKVNKNIAFVFLVPALAGCTSVWEKPERMWYMDSEDKLSEVCEIFWLHRFPMEGVIPDASHRSSRLTLEGLINQNGVPGSASAAAWEEKYSQMLSAPGDSLTLSISMRMETDGYLQAVGRGGTAYLGTRTVRFECVAGEKRLVRTFQVRQNGGATFNARVDNLTQSQASSLRGYFIREACIEVEEFNEQYETGRQTFDIECEIKGQ